MNFLQMYHSCTVDLEMNEQTKNQIYAFHFSILRGGGSKYSLFSMLQTPNAKGNLRRPLNLPTSNAAPRRLVDPIVGWFYSLHFSLVFVILFYTLALTKDKGE